jgi:hypothetical protein
MIKPMVLNKYNYEWFWRRCGQATNEGKALAWLSNKKVENHCNQGGRELDVYAIIFDKRL